MKPKIKRKMINYKSSHLSIELDLLDVTFLIHIGGGGRRGYRGMVDNRDAEGRGGRGRSWHRAVTQTGAQEREAGEQDDLRIGSSS